MFGQWTTSSLTKGPPRVVERPADEEIGEGSTTLSAKSQRMILTIKMSTDALGSGPRFFIPRAIQCFQQHWHSAVAYGGAHFNLCRVKPRAA